MMIALRLGANSVKNRYREEEGEEEEKKRREKKKEKRQNKTKQNKMKRIRCIFLRITEHISNLEQIKNNLRKAVSVLCYLVSKTNGSFGTIFILLRAKALCRIKSSGLSAKVTSGVNSIRSAAS